MRNESRRLRRPMKDLADAHYSFRRIEPQGQQPVDLEVPAIGPITSILASSAWIIQRAKTRLCRDLVIRRSVPRDTVPVNAPSRLSG